MPDALSLIREDHRKVQDLFKQFEQTEDKNQKHRIAQQAMMELEVHALIEEEVFYPAVREENEDVDKMMNEAEQEHHVAKILIEELKGMRANDKMFEAKFTVLAESVKHHIQEEESEMLPKAAESGGALMQSLGEEMEEIKIEAMQEMESGGRGRATRGAASSRGGTRGRAATKTTRASSGGTRGGTSRKSGARTTSRASSGTASRSGGTARSASGARGRTTRASSGTARKATRGGGTARSGSTNGRKTASSSSRGGTRTGSRSRSMGSTSRPSTTSRSRSTAKRSGGSSSSRGSSTKSRSSSRR